MHVVISGYRYIRLSCNPGEISESPIKEKASGEQERGGKVVRRRGSLHLHKPVRRKFPRNRVYVTYKAQQFEADLVDMSHLSKYNDGYRYLLTCIDV